MAGTGPRNLRPSDLKFMEALKNSKFEGKIEKNSKKLIFNHMIYANKLIVNFMGKNSKKLIFNHMIYANKLIVNFMGKTIL